MNKKIILDASALLALLNQESGHERVESALSNAIISSVNYSETVSVLVNIGISYNQANEVIHNLVQEIVPFDTKQALKTALLRKTTQHIGLSFGDRACLALGTMLKGHILTADKIWGKLDLADVKIEVIR